MTKSQKNRKKLRKTKQDRKTEKNKKIDEGSMPPSSISSV
jgi:hypothetical protein